MVVITCTDSIHDEVAVINQLFEAGLAVLHIRKPNATLSEIQYYIEQIRHEYHSKLALHEYFELTKLFNINRLHFTENTRTDFKIIMQRLESKDWIFSAATHSISDFNALPNIFSYAFLSPVYNSISKPGYESPHDIKASVHQRINTQTKLVALGGISSINCKEAVASGFDGVALLGAIWSADDPLTEFKKCQQALNYVQ